MCTWEPGPGAAAPTKDRPDRTTLYNLLDVRRSTQSSYSDERSAEQALALSMQDFRTIGIHSDD